GIEGAPTQLVDQCLAAGGSRTYVPRDQLQELRLARAVGADECPLPCALELERDVFERPILVAPHAHRVQRDGEACPHGIRRQRPSFSAALPSLLSLIRCASKLRRATACRSFGTSS